MSLLVDGDYAIYQLRLAYLRRVDDHFGPRVLSFADLTDLPSTTAAAASGQTASLSSSSSSSRIPVGGSRHPSNNGSSSSSSSTSLNLGSFGSGATGYPSRSFSQDGGYDSTAATAAFVGEERRRRPAMSTLPPLASDSHVVMAGLNSARYHPELANLYSPLPHDNLPPGASLSTFPTTSSFPPSSPSAAAGVGVSSAMGTLGLPASKSGTAVAGRQSDPKNAGGLRYTTTIYGPGRTGAMGMRVNGRRAPSEEGHQRRSKARNAVAAAADSDEMPADTRPHAFSPLRATTAAARVGGSTVATEMESSGSSRSRSGSSSSGISSGSKASSGRIGNRPRVPALAIQGSTYGDYDNPQDTTDSQHSRLDIPGDALLMRSHGSGSATPRVPRRRSSSQPPKPSSAAAAAVAASRREMLDKAAAGPFQTWGSKSSGPTVSSSAMQEQQQEQQTPKTARPPMLDVHSETLVRTPTAVTAPARPPRSIRRASSVRDAGASPDEAHGMASDGAERAFDLAHERHKTLRQSKSIPDLAGHQRQLLVEEGSTLRLPSPEQGERRVEEEEDEGDGGAQEERDMRWRSEAFQKHLEQQRDSVGSDGTAKEAQPSSSSRRGTVTSEEGRSSSFDGDTFSENRPWEMGRTESNSTIFSLASPPQTRPRALSDRRADDVLRRSKTFGPLPEADESPGGRGVNASSSKRDEERERHNAGRGIRAGAFSLDAAAVPSTMPMPGNLYGHSEANLSPLSRDDRLLFPHGHDDGGSSIGDNTTSSASRSFADEADGSVVSSLGQNPVRGMVTTTSDSTIASGRRQNWKTNALGGEEDDDDNDDDDVDEEGIDEVEDVMHTNARQADTPVLVHAGSSAGAEADNAAPIRTALGLEMGGNAAVDGEPAIPALHPPSQAISSRAVSPNHLEEKSPRKKATSAVAKKRSRKELKNEHAIELQNQWFASLKKPVVPVPQAQGSKGAGKVSALSALLQTRSDGPVNDFTQLYKGVAGSSVSGGSSTNVEIYFPLAKISNSTSAPGGKTRSGALQLNGKKRSMTLNVRRDATMEELIGYSLYCYVEEGWRPALDEGLAEDSSEEDRGIRLSTNGWTLRIVEDGEVDDDYPAIDRSLQVGKFGADELAICEATPAQIKQHLASGEDPEKRASRIQSSIAVNNALSARPTFNQPQQSQLLKPPTASLAKASSEQDQKLGPQSLATTMPPGPSARLAATAGNVPAGSLVSIQGTPIFTSSTLSRSSAAGPSSAPIFLRVLITPNDQVRYKTTLQVPSDMYLADVLETICKKRHLADAEHWALVVPDRDNTVVPLDRTVESLQGNHDLALVRRSTLDLPQGGRAVLNGQSTNPNASIFKRVGGGPMGAMDDAGRTRLLLEQSGQQSARLYKTGKDITSTYKSYTVNRKMPSFLGRHERILTIDGDWLHIIPTDTRAFYNTHSATASFPIGAVISCKQQSRIASNFKLVVARENDQKRYDFEAENARLAAEIVQEINSLLKKP